MSVSRPSSPAKIAHHALRRARRITSLVYWRAHRIAFFIFWRAHRIAFFIYWRAHHFVFLAYWRARSAPRQAYWAWRRVRSGASERFFKALGPVGRLYMERRRLRTHWTGRVLRRVGTYKPLKHATASAHAVRVTQIAPSECVTYKAPNVFGPLPQGWEDPWADIRVTFPGLQAMEWREAVVLGRSDSVYVRGYAISNDHLNIDTERTYDEVHGFALLLGEEQILRRFADQPSGQLDNAIVIVGGPTANWAHWTTEYLPKLALVDLVPAYREWPLVVDANLHRNILDSLMLVGAGKRNIVVLAEGALLTLKRAVTVTSPGYTAYEYRYDRERELPGFEREHTVFSPFALDLVRSRAWGKVGAVPARERLIYITRPKGSARPFVGCEAVEAYFASEGFEIVDTGGMSVIEQVALFSRARCIVGQSGAGMTNLVFAPPGCSVIVLAANSPHSIFHYFANMGAAAGHRVHYCYGESIYTDGGHPGHAGFSVNITDVQQAWSITKAETLG
jgi:capsular polysaccharide biosynthesis protein